jgi:hypothetical protein
MHTVIKTLIHVSYTLILRLLYVVARTCSQTFVLLASPTKQALTAPQSSCYPQRCDQTSQSTSPPNVSISTGAILSPRNYCYPKRSNSASHYVVEYYFVRYAYNLTHAVSEDSVMPDPRCSNLRAPTARRHSRRSSPATCQQGLRSRRTASRNAISSQMSGSLRVLRARGAILALDS